MDDLISRQALCEYALSQKDKNVTPNDIMRFPSAQPELTDDRAIEHLQSTGLMQNHDKEMYEMGLMERLADDSGSYDSLIPCEDAISRTVAIDAFEKECLQPESEYVFYDSDHGFCINTQDVLDCLRKELRNG